jgi:hypothetical protein
MILSPNRRPHNLSSPVVATASGLLKYLSRHLGLGELLDAVDDGRDESRITVRLGAVLRAVVGGLLLGIGSIRGIEDRLVHSKRFRAFIGLAGTFSDDTAREALTRLEPARLERALYELAGVALRRWRAGRYLDSELARRLRPLNASFIASRAVVALDGHETFCSEKRRCEACHTRKKTVKRGKTLLEVEENYHKLVVAQQVGSHPAVVLDVEPIVPGESEVTAAYRLVERLGRVFGNVIGTVVADAAHDSEPFRSACLEAGFWSVVRHKDEKREPGYALKRALDARHPANRVKPDGWHRDPTNGNLYEYWLEREPHQGRSYVEVRRTRPDGNVMVGGLVTDLPLGKVSPMVAAFIMEARWWLENTGFHELSGQFYFDRAFVHAGKPTGAWAMVVLTLLAYNVWQLYLYRHLGLDPSRPSRTWGDLRRDLWESLHELLRPPRFPAPLRPP